MSKATLQQYADGILAEEYRQPLMTVVDAFAKIDWEFAENPVCCGEPVKVASFLGDAYKAECQQCHKFIFDVTGPRFAGNGVGAVYLFPWDEVDGETDKRWISGCRP